MSETQTPSLYDRIGGEAAVDAAVDLFYKKVLADDRIKHFFEGVDMSKQIGHQKKFLTYAFGGAPQYTGRSMRAAHKRLVEEMGLNESHFHAVMENLGATLQELGVPMDMIGEAAAIAESTKGDVLNK
ncbi:group 1 truncated hemoglobin [Pelagicoccus sp. SDUM812003]|uniref:group I truncated hemoglobin n=1 Tax=Pelagicoccus sp. SDUM812003 TaxID=3041267 RepID=UPI00280D29A4|nr:group 1 truncated hemoglobin [Pelagicoccus sp. SDUM812003]MDQ8203707.1 group 1 truncated hemoglobin [Pelagicoccus sp. SDUM812003]